MKKLISVLLAILLLTPILSIGVTAANTPSDVAPCYITVTVNTPTLIIGSNGVATCKGLTKTAGEYTIETTMQLQYRDGSTWYTDKTWYDNGTQHLTITHVRAINAGYEYKLVLTTNIYDSNHNYIVNMPERMVHADRGNGAVSPHQMVHSFR